MHIIYSHQCFCECIAEYYILLYLYSCVRKKEKNNCNYYSNAVGGNNKARALAECLLLKMSTVLLNIILKVYNMYI